jgi:hypothetical protein
MKTTIIAVLAVMVLSACTKNEPSIHKTNLSYRNAASLSMEEAANPANPYDSAGFLHNKIVDAVIKQTTAQGDTSIQAIALRVIAFRNNGSTALNMQTLMSANSIVFKNEPDSFRQLIDGSELSGSAKGYLHALMQIVKDTTVYNNPSIAYKLLHDRIVNLEDLILNNGQITNDDRQAVLSVTSIARYSLYYWMHQDRQYSLKKIIRAIATATGDIGGAIEGYLTGDIIGTASEASAWWYWAITNFMPD